MAKAHEAFRGRVVFKMNYETMAHGKQARRIFKAIKATQTDSEDDLPIANLAIYLATTEDIEFNAPMGEHDEIDGLMAFWHGWEIAKTSAEPRYEALWELALDNLGRSVLNEWDKAYNQAQAMMISAPVALLPNDALTPEDKADPNLNSVGLPPVPTSDAT